MSTKDLIKEKLEHIHEEEVLSSILEMLQLEVELNQTEVKLTTAQKKAIDHGLDDIANGRTLSHEEARQKVNKWFEGK